MFEFVEKLCEKAHEVRGISEITTSHVNWLKNGVCTTTNHDEHVQFPKFLWKTRLIHRWNANWYWKIAQQFPTNVHSYLYTIQKNCIIELLTNIRNAFFLSCGLNRQKIQKAELKPKIHRMNTVRVNILWTLLRTLYIWRQI